MAATRRGRVVLGALILVVAAAAGITVKALWTTAKDHLTADHCTIGAYDLDTSQTAVAATMTAAVTSYSQRLPDRAAILVIAAGLQESKLRNLAGGDRDSVGVLQQRPSQGWGNGDVNVLRNVFKATTEFLDHLVNVPNWEHLPLAEAVQDVQNSADESAYAQHEPEAKALTQALLGRTATGVTCEFAKPTKVATTTAVVTRLTAELPVNKPTVSAARITVPGAAWQTVAWFVAYADRLGIDSVSYNGKEWTRSEGWHASKTATRTAVIATMATVKNS